MCKRQLRGVVYRGTCPSFTAYEQKRCTIMIEAKNNEKIKDNFIKCIDKLKRRAIIKT